MKKTIGLLLTASFMFIACGTAFATETAQQEEESAFVEIMTGPGPAVIEMDADGLDWAIEQLDSLSDIVSNVGDCSYDADTAGKYDIHMGVTYDKDVVNAVLFNTSIIDFSTPGEYGTTYWVFFNRESLLDYMSKSGLDPEDYPGLAEAMTDHVVCRIDAVTTINDAGITDAEEGASDEDSYEEGFYCGENGYTKEDAEDRAAELGYAAGSKAYQDFWDGYNDGFYNRTDGDNYAFGYSIGREGYSEEEASDMLNSDGEMDPKSQYTKDFWNGYYAGYADYQNEEVGLARTNAQMWGYYLAEAGYSWEQALAEVKEGLGITPDSGIYYDDFKWGYDYFYSLNEEQSKQEEYTVEEEPVAQEEPFVQEEPLMEEEPVIQEEAEEEFYEDQSGEESDLP